MTDIKRYDVTGDHGYSVSEFESIDGEWVRHEDHAAAISAAIEECAALAERLAAERRAKEASYGYGPETASPIANVFWCEEIAMAIRALISSPGKDGGQEVEAVDLPWRTKDLMRGLILFRTSNNAHGYTNVSILSERVGSLPQVAKDELANMMRNIAADLSPTGEEAVALYQVELEDGTIDHISGVFGMPVQINGIPVSKVTPLYARPQPASTALVERLTKALEPFCKHYEPWMERWDDQEASSTFSRHTFGDLREALAAINEARAALSASQSTSREGER